jgi:hypothetical protein
VAWTVGRAHPVVEAVRNDLTLMPKR